MGDFQYFTEFMKKWLTEKGASKTNANVLLERIKEGMGDILENIYEDAEEEKQYCSIRDTKGKEILKDEISKALCKILIRIFYWMDGLRQKGNKKEEIWEWERRVLTDSAEKELQDYLRCIVGKIVIVRMFGKHCRLNEVTPIVKKAIEGNIGKKGVEKEHKKCEEMDFESLKIGGKIFWEEIEKSIERNNEGGETIRKIKKQGQCGGNDVTKRTEDNNTDDEWRSTIELLGLNNKDHLQGLIADSDTWSKGGLNKILCYMKDKGDIEEVKKILVLKHHELGEIYKESVKEAKDSQEDRCGNDPTISGTNEEDSSPPSTIQTFNGGQSSKSSTPGSDQADHQKPTSSGPGSTSTKDTSPAQATLAEVTDKGDKKNEPVKDGQGVQHPNHVVGSSGASGDDKSEAAGGAEAAGPAGPVEPQAQPIEPRTGTVDASSSSTHQPSGAAGTGVLGDLVPGAGVPVAVSPATIAGGGGPGGPQGQSGSTGNQNTGSPRPAPPQEAAGRSKAQKVVNVKEEGMDNPSDFLAPYLPTIPVLIGTVAIAFLLLKYFGMFGPQKKRYKRMTQIPGPPLEEHRDGSDVTISYAPYEYILMKEGKGHPLHSTEMQQEEHVNRKTIIDIHLELLNESQNQNEEPELTNRVDFLENIMAEEFIKEEHT
ncbi:SICA-like antigen, partial [Plasmodium coatneyi]